ncbi:MAG: methylated-DNA--[protein]-cysteine S-methyltransferase [Phycisphaerae bacterium]
MQYTIFATPWGDFAFVDRNTRIVASYLLCSRRTMLQRIGREWPDAQPADDLMPEVRREILRYFEGEPVSLDVPIDLSSVSPFRRRVLEICREIPYGQTSSYAELARLAGSPAAARAVGGAMAHNPISLLVPCHRVLRSDGSLGGFSSPHGTDLKQRLLAMERRSAAVAITANRRVDGELRQRQTADRHGMLPVPCGAPPEGSGRR